MICSDLLNCLRSVGTMVITTEVDKITSKSFSIRNSSLKAAIFRCFDLFPVRPSQKFQVQAKISTIRSVFPDYFSVSFNYVENLSIKPILAKLRSISNACFYHIFKKNDVRVNDDNLSKEKGKRNRYVDEHDFDCLLFFQNSQNQV